MLVIEIYNPTGGSVLSNQNNVTVVILANDNVAGVLGFVQLSHIVSEGLYNQSIGGLLNNPLK